MLQGIAAKPFELRVLPTRPHRPFSTGASIGGGGRVFDRAQTFLFGRVRAALGIAGEHPSATLALTASGFVLTLLVASNDRQKAYRESAVGRARTETDAILAARVPPPVADEVNCYVPRRELEAALAAYLQQPYSASGTYLVVYGARGAGKSTLVEHVLSKSGAGVVVVKTGDAQSADLDTLVVDTALKQRRAAQPGAYVPPEALKGQLYERLAQVTQAYRAAHPDEPHWRPTVVFDVDKSGDSKLIASVCAHAKQLTHDKGLCHGILVLSSSFAVAEMPADPGRQEFVRVGSFTLEEASAVLDATLATLPKQVASDAAVVAVKERTLPLTTLAKFIGKLGADLRCSTSEADLRTRTETWASAFEAAARDDVQGALTLDHASREPPLFRLAALMREILDAGGRVKLPIAKYNAEAATFASKIRVSAAAKATFSVDLVAKTVEFASGAHRAAAAEAEAVRARTPSRWWGRE
jgi:energy-coupling factor transporter ATP-binding protein EcfA2